MIFKKLALVFCVLCSFFICSCLEYMEYTFVNKSSYTIEISLSEQYKNESSTDAPYYKNSFSVYSGRTETKFVKGNEVDFTWSTYSANDSSKIHCTVSGSKATFEDQ